MRFFLLNQFYPPDTAPTGRYLHGLAVTLSTRGHQVKVLCSRRSYDGTNTFTKHENRDGVEVVRLPATGFGRQGFLGKLCDYTSFYLSLAKALIFSRPRPDLILALTTPPYIGLLGKIAAQRHKSHHAHWIMDLYPDVMHAHRMAQNGGFLFRSLHKLTQLQLQGARAVLTLGPNMAKKVSAYLVSPGKKDVEPRLEFQLSTFNPQLSEASAQLSGLSPQPSDSEFQLSAFSSHPFSPNPQPSTLNPQLSEPTPQLSVFSPQPSIIAPQVSGLSLHPSDSRSQHSTLSPQLFTIPLWSDPKLAPWPEEEPNPLRSERGWCNTETVFLYSGNMGLGHRFNEFLEAAKRLGNSGPRWVFAGGGKRKPEVENFARSHPKARIQFLGQVSHHQLRAHLCAADVHLASLDSAWEGLIVPSKLQASFAVGRPVIYVGGPNSETATWIRESAGGWVVKENDLDGLLRAITQASNFEERRRRGCAALAYARKHFCMAENCTRLAEILENAAAS